MVRRGKIVPLTPKTMEEMKTVTVTLEENMMNTART